MDRTKFGLGFLKGRADSFRRGLLTIAHVEGAASMAARYGVADHDIAAMLIVYGACGEPDGHGLEKLLPSLVTTVCAMTVAITVAKTVNASRRGLGCFGCCVISPSGVTARRGTAV